MRCFIPRGSAAALLSLLLVSLPAAAQETFSRRNPVVEAVQKTKASIVCIRVPRPGGGKDMIGSGVIVDPRGIVVTNRHVVGANRQVTVCLFDGTTLPGEVLVGDPGRDLAIVRVSPAKKLTALPLAPIDDLMVGETVIAI